jgi:hypothetical protein
MDGHSELISFFSAASRGLFETLSERVAISHSPGLGRAVRDGSLIMRHRLIDPYLLILSSLEDLGNHSHVKDTWSHKQEDMQPWVVKIGECGPSRASPR